MTEQEKQLLLADLCARLPYNVRIRHYVNDIDFYSNPLMTYDINQLENNKAIIKPYLRPLSSMTEDETKEYHEVIIESQNCSFGDNESATTMVSDWLLSKHFDVRGLITKGLALKAPKGMYKI